jgi:hypothetical protein
VQPPTAKANKKMTAKNFILNSNTVASQNVSRARQNYFD